MSKKFTTKSFLYTPHRKSTKILVICIQKKKESKKLVESLQYIAESLVWSEQHNMDFYQ